MYNSLTDLLANASGKFMCVEYYGLDKQFRKRVVRTGVKKHISRVSEFFQRPLTKNVIRVYDVTAKGYRSIRVESITRIKYKGIYFIPRFLSRDGELAWV